eukprot:symbB.v1.2.037401.t1/scaffold5483.1/size26653/1
MKTESCGVGGAAVAVTAIGHGALRRPRRIGEGQRGLRGRRTTGLRLRNGQGWQGMRRRATWDGHRLNAPACIGPQATAHGMCLPRGNLWTGVHQQGHQALGHHPQLLLRLIGEVLRHHIGVVPHPMPKGPLRIRGLQWWRMAIAQALLTPLPLVRRSL